MERTELKIIWNKTAGHCHFCGLKTTFSSYGPKASERGKWQVDHIFPKQKGGINSLENYLAICRKCNRLRWMWTGNKIRKLFRYGIVAYNESCRNTDTGKEIKKLYLLHERKKKEKRRNKKR